MGLSFNATASGSYQEMVADGKAQAAAFFGTDRLKLTDGIVEQNPETGQYDGLMTFEMLDEDEGAILY